VSIDSWNHDQAPFRVARCAFTASHLSAISFSGRIALTTALSICLLVLLCIALVPVLVLLTQVLLALLPVRAAAPASGPRPRIAILIPAHNEEAGLLATLSSLQPQLGPHDRILVVADNCNDRTAALARRAGVDVVERSHAHLRGKGYALDCGVQALAAAPPEVVIIVDADCIVGAGAIARLAGLAVQHHRPVQALYLMYTPAASGPLKKIAEFAWIVKNKVRPLGWFRLGWPCQLMGTGMAFEWQTIHAARLATGHIVEDMKLGMDLALAGHAPMFCPDALVHSYFPTSQEGVASQRTRWEHGHLSMIASTVPRTLLAAVRRASPRLLAFGLDLCVPPLALLVLLVCGLTGISLLLAWSGGTVAPLALGLLAGAALGVAILLAWWHHGRAVLSGKELALAAVYVMAKIPLYCRFLFQRQVAWVRSKRDSE
jgi:cellulose synthase/poly-beta-1,6-N-acetylglucosamine synthase-like glycosyltransferase